MNQFFNNLAHAFNNLHVSLPTILGAGLGIAGVIWPAHQAQFIAIAGILVSYGVIAAANTPPSSQTPPSGSSAGGRVPIIFLFVIAGSVGLALGLTACSTTPQQASYRAAGTTVVTVDTAMNLWGAYVGANHPGTNEEAAVKSAYEKYQTSMAIVCDAGAAYAASGGTNSTASAAVDEAIANSSQELTDLENLIESFGVKLQ